MIRKWYTALTPLGRFALHALCAVCICGAFASLAISLVNARTELRRMREHVGPCMEYRQRTDAAAVNLKLQGAR